MHRASPLVLLLVALAGGVAAAEPLPALRGFHLGNSLTWGVLSLPRFAALMGHGGSEYRHGMHILWGASLKGLTDKADAPSVKADAYGPYPTALAGHTWDVVTLQPSFAGMDGPDGDVAVAQRLIALAVARSPEAQVLVYETWPTLGKDAAAGTFAAKWERPWEPGRWDGALYSGDYCRRLVERLRAEEPTATLRRPVRLIPAGSVLHALDGLARAGKLPGIAGIESVYSDGTHLGPIGNYAAACAWYAVIRGADPSGLPADVRPPEVGEELGRVIGATAWDVVTRQPLTGVAASR